MPTCRAALLRSVVYPRRALGVLIVRRVVGEDVEDTGDQKATEGCSGGRFTGNSSASNPSSSPAKLCVTPCHMEDMAPNRDVGLVRLGDGDGDGGDEARCRATA